MTEVGDDDPDVVIASNTFRGWHPGRRKTILDDRIATTNPKDRMDAISDLLFPDIQLPSMYGLHAASNEVEYRKTRDRICHDIVRKLS